MKITVSSILMLALIIVTTVMVAQNLNEKKAKAADTIAYIKREMIGGVFDFRYVLKNPSEVITHQGMRFNKNDYYVFLWGEAVSNMGLGSAENAARLWEEIHHQKLTNPQRAALRG